MKTFSFFSNFYFFKRLVEKMNFQKQIVISLTKEYYDKFITKLDLVLDQQYSSIRMSELDSEVKIKLKKEFFYTIKKFLLEEISQFKSNDWIYLHYIIETAFKNALDLIILENIDPILSLCRNTLRLKAEDPRSVLSRRGTYKIDPDDPEFDYYVVKDMEFAEKFENCFKDLFKLI